MAFKVDIQLRPAITQLEEFESTPLAQMPEWIATGVVPAGADLRAAGLECWGDVSISMRLYGARRVFIERYGFSIPCAEALDAIKALGPVVEIGAGTGYWSAILRARGADVVTTDLGAPDVRSGYGFTVGLHAPGILQLNGSAAVRSFSDRAVFCSWPSLNEKWCTVAARQIRPGQHFALIGEGEDGCTGHRSLFRLLDRDFEGVATVDIPQFPGMHDFLAIYRRRA